MTRKKFASDLLNCAIILMTLTFCIFGQEKSSDLKDKRITIHKEKTSLGDIFGELIDKYDVAIGFEDSTLDSDHIDYYFKTAKPYKLDKVTFLDGNFPIKEHWFTINVDNARLEDVLNELIPQLKNYKWEINDDVVNIIPVKGRDKRYQTFLESNIANFTFGKDEPISQIRKRIFELPEVKNFLAENNLSSSSNINFLLYRQKKLGINLNFSNLTFRELLNKITKAKRGGWILRKNYFYSKESDCLEIDI